MPDRFDALPILAELRADLAAAFRRAAESEDDSPAFDAAESRNAARRRRGVAVPRTRRRVPRPRRWVLPAGGLLAAGAVAAAIALVSGAESGRVSPPPANAAEALRRVAAIAQQMAAPVPRDDQYYYVHSQGTNLSMTIGRGSAVSRLITSDRRIWLSIQRPGRLLQHTTAVAPLTPDDAKRPSPDDQPGPNSGRPETMAPASHYFLGNEQLSRAQLLAYPTDPRAIHDRLLAGLSPGQGHSPEGEVFTLIGDALREAPAPPDLRAGLYGALALIPGIELVGTVHDRTGREGTAVAFTEQGIRKELVFDPQTSEMLAEREVLTDGPHGIHAPAGTVIEDVVYLQRAVTDDLSAPGSR
jgi:hypothetical protein